VQRTRHNPVAPEKKRMAVVMKNLTKETFCAEMEQIDAELKGLEIEIAVRPIRALSELSKRFGVAFPVIFGQVTDESPYVPGLLPSHVQRWYDVRYGDRMKLGALPRQDRR
jgi:hypothetical protein